MLRENDDVNDYVVEGNLLYRVIRKLLYATSPCVYVLNMEMKWYDVMKGEKYAPLEDSHLNNCIGFLSL